MKPVIKVLALGYRWQCVGDGWIGVDVTPAGAYWQWFDAVWRKKAIWSETIAKSP